MTKFFKDKKSGDFAENLFIALLKKYNCKIKLNKSEKREELAGWDIQSKIDGKIVFFEIKYDLMSQKTGNLAIEYFNPKKNKPSGINVTTSNIWVYVLPDKSIWFASVKDIKDFIKKIKPFRIINIGGDKNASLYLYKKNKILNKLFTRIDILTHQDFLDIINKYEL